MRSGFSGLLIDLHNHCLQNSTDDFSRRNNRSHILEIYIEIWNYPQHRTFQESVILGQRCFGKQLSCDWK